MSLGIEAAELIQVDTNDVGVSGILLHSLNVTAPYQPVLLSVYPRSREHSLYIYVGYDVTPTTSTYDYYTQVTHEHRVYVSNVSPPPVAATTIYIIRFTCT